MTTHQALLRSLPPALTLPQVARLLRVPLEDVLQAAAGLQFVVDNDLRVCTSPLLAELGLLHERSVQP